MDKDNLIKEALNKDIGIITQHIITGGIIYLIPTYIYFKEIFPFLGKSFFGFVFMNLSLFVMLLFIELINLLILMGRLYKPDVVHSKVNRGGTK